MNEKQTIKIICFLIVGVLSLTFCFKTKSFEVRYLKENNCIFSYSRTDEKGVLINGYICQGGLFYETKSKRKTPS